MQYAVVGLLISLLMSGCATPAAPIQIDGIERSAGVHIIDLRPPIEREGETFSVLITSDAYGTSRIEEA